MRPYRSRTSTAGRNMAGARALWRATGMTDADFEKPIIAIANSYTQFVPGHMHLKDLGALVAREIEAAGGISKEFHTIAVDDGIANGHDGMLYSLPSRELIADSVEYMVNAHCADALVCISNCDKITPGMLMAALRLNVPTIFVSGGPMEAGRARLAGEHVKVHLVSAMTIAADRTAGDDLVAAVERSACPTCGSCSGMFTANSMNCLTEALGLSLPGNGTLVATHADREQLFLEAGRTIVRLARRYYEDDDETALPRGIATRAAFANAMTVDIAMGGSTNTVLHLLAAAREADVDFTMADIDALSRRTPHLCKVAPASDDHYIEDVHRAGGIPAILGELDRAGLIDTSVPTVHSATLGDALARWDVRAAAVSETVESFFRAAPAGVRTTKAFSQDTRWPALDLDCVSGCIRDVAHAYSADGGLAVLYGNLAADGCIVKTAAVDAAFRTFSGPARVYDAQESLLADILDDRVHAGDAIVVRYEGPKGGPGMQEMLLPTSSLKGRGLATQCALVTDGRFSGGSSGLAIGHVSPEAAAGGAIGLVRDGDRITIDIPKRTITLEVEDDELDDRRNEEQGRAAAWTPHAVRQRTVSSALRAYAALVSSAAHGAVRTMPGTSRHIGDTDRPRQTADVGGLRRYRSFGFDSARWQSLRFRPDDIVISTPPKSGTTWLQMMCALLIFQETAFEQPLTRISPWLETSTEPLDSVLRTLDAQTHRRFIKAHLPLDGLPVDQHAKYICVGRDPRDVAVSWMHHEANVDVELLIKLRIDAVGLDGLEDVPPFRRPPADRRERFWYWIDQPTDTSVASSLAATMYHLETFWSKRTEPNIALFHYSDMSRDLDAEMRRLAAFLEIDVPDGKWDELVTAASFANMRAHARELAPEATQGFVNPDKFFRRAGSGEWRDFIRTDDEVKRYEARVAVLGDADLTHWAHTGRTDDR